jgi:hypothetical protein
MDQVDELAMCRVELQRLEAENAALRYSSESFGDLAERLNVALTTERARVPRRQSPRTDGPPRTSTT